MIIPNKDQFEPTKETLHKWLAIRKPEYYVAGGQYPAYLNSSSNNPDSAWFFFAALGELAGLVTTIYGGFTGGASFVALAIIGAVLFVIADFVLAFLLHKCKNVECIVLSRKALNENAQYRLAQDLILKKEKRFNWLYKLLIVALAIFKVFAILILGVFDSPLMYFQLLAIFLIIAYIHINHTGYFLAYESTLRSLNRDYKDFANGKNLALSIEYPLQLETKISGNEITFAPHKIVQEKQENMVAYKLIKRGVLTDDDIMGLISNQTDATKVELFKRLREIQL
jgi:hypothetical protein